MEAPVLVLFWFLRYWSMIIMIKERKHIPKLFINLNLDDIVQLKFTDYVFVPMNTFTCCQNTTAF